jgi:hypothetical protein
MDGGKITIVLSTPLIVFCTIAAAPSTVLA